MRASSRRQLDERFSVRLFVRDSSGNQRHLDPALEPGRIEGRIAAARMERGGIEAKRAAPLQTEGAAAPPATNPPVGTRRTRAGREVIVRMPRGRPTCPPATRRRLAESIVSTPIAPAPASAKGSRLGLTSCGAP